MTPIRKRRSQARLRHLVRRVTRMGAGRLLRAAYLAGLLLSAAIAIDLGFPGRSIPDLPRLEAGLVADQDVIAPTDFTVYKPPEQLTRERAEAAASVSPIYELRPEIADSSLSNAETFFGAIETALANVEGEEDRLGTVREILRVYQVPASDSQLPVLTDAESRRRLRRSLESAFSNTLRSGVARADGFGGAESGGITLREDDEVRFVSRESLMTMQEFWRRAVEQAPSRLSIEGINLYRSLLIRFSEPTIRLDQEATANARRRAQQSVDSVKYSVLEGEMIVAEHERIGSDAIEKFRALESHLAQAEGGRAWPAHVGGVLYNVLLLIGLGLFVKYYRPRIYDSNRSLTLLWFLVLSVAAAAALISRTDAPPELIPVAFAALTLATLYDGALALLTVFVLVALVAAQEPSIGTPVLFSAVLGGSAAALSGRVVRRRAHAWSFAVVIAAAYVAAAVSLALISRQSLSWVALGSFWGTLNAIGCTVLATGILPLAESFTRITTDQSLLELADLNRPILRRLSLEAPGTYAHSINVANLAEAAAREIGANSLLVRVGVYYHDIGKVGKPQYFVENQPPGRNPHDKLKPSTSVAIVREHVEDGLELAEEERLPDVVKAFITEHHGTQRIGFFFEKARELESEADLDPNDFRYPGPRPQSKETAIALLADSVESAARVLQDPTPERITEMVNRIVDYKISEQQLDEAPLTLREISLIKAQFVKVLTSMYHHRIDYPIQTPAAQPEQQVAGEAT